MIAAATLAIACPLLVALVGLLLGGPREAPPPVTRRWSASARLAVASVAVSTAATAWLAVDQWLNPRTHEAALTLVPTGTLPVGVSLHVDGLSAVVAFMVCCVALAVQVYSVAALRGGPRYPSYTAFVSLFTSAMLLVVLSGDLLVLYVGWEVMGICSYFLIGHHREDRDASRGAVTAFLVTRIGDVGLLFGIFVLGVGAGSFDIRYLTEHAAELPYGVAVAGTLLLICGVVGKSAQFPLHTWLPATTAGPVPVGALIQAATMVAAGGYVVARLYPVFLTAPGALPVLGVVAAVSMLGAALAALAQDDLKRVLAYSTISQSAYVSAGLAVGARNGAVFHLLVHGAFKAVLFLGAGCVVAVVGSNLMGAMGGLRHAMPVTFASMTVGFASLAAIPPAGGFFSENPILSQAWHVVQGADVGGSLALAPTRCPPCVGVQGYMSLDEARRLAASDLPSWVGWLVLITGLVTVALTAAYATRAWLLTFFGERRSAFRPREAAPLLRRPVAALAVPAGVAGFFGLGASDLRPEAGPAMLSVALSLVGAGSVFAVWNHDPALDPARLLGPARPVLAAAFHVDALYTAVVVRPVRALARGAVRADGLVDAAVGAVGHGTRRLGGPLRSMHNGSPRTYVTGVLTGVVLIAVAVVVLS